jgi:hypothetical protein
LHLNLAMEPCIKRRVLQLILLGAAAAACASQSTYIPEERATATLGGRTAAVYGLPSQQGRQGDIRLASYGVAKFKYGEDQSFKAIHLRLAVSDSGNESMVLDTRAQRLQLPDGRQIPAAYVASESSARPPLIQVSPGSARTVDLYFPIPQDLTDDESSPPQFDVVWQVRVGSDTVSEITPFDQVAVDPAVARQELAEDVVNDRVYYWGDPYWRSTLVGPPVWGW